MTTKTKCGFDFDSFDRFGDDLCELLLSYLSFEDKFGYECVSQQWKRLVFNKHQKLLIPPKKWKKTPKIWGKVEENVWFRRELNINTINENVIKKMNSIKELKVNKLDNELLDIIINNCHYLENIEVLFELKSGLDFNKFGEKYGKNLKLFDNHFGHEYKGVDVIPYHLFPNLEKVCDFINKNFDPFIKQLFPKLNDIYLSDDFDLNNFKTFTDKYFKQIKNIRINFYRELSENQNFSLIDTIRKTLSQVSRYVNLVSLKIIFNTDLAIDYELKSIANRCKKLKILIITSFGDQYVIEEKLFDTFGLFYGLEKLKLEFKHKIDNYGNISAFDKCFNLKYLELNFCDLTDDNLNNIHSYLPNLVHFISLKDTKISDKTLYDLSLIKNLSKLALRKNRSSFMTDAGISHLIKFSPEITRFSFRPKIIINKEVIDSLIDRAHKNPKIEIYIEFVEFDKSKHDQNLPKNLILKNYGLHPNKFANFVMRRNRIP